MYFEPSYFEGEEREGFFVKPMMKRVWAAQLEVLQEIDIICKRHNIQYYAEYGTLLGAVRHKGYIPWDDDLDIGMTRENYQLFLHYASTELPKEYIISTAKTNEAFTQLVTRINNSNCINTDPEFMNKFHGCPYIVGLDIFVTDRIPINPQEEETQIALLLFAWSLGQNWNKDTLSESEKWADLAEFEEYAHVKIDRTKPIPQQLMILVDYISAMYWDAEATEVSLMPKLAQNKAYRLPISCYASTIEVPFENTTIPILTAYDHVLTRRYGSSYMTPRQYTNHGYPYYESQEKCLFAQYEKLGYPIPSFLKE